MHMIIATSDEAYMAPNIYTRSWSRTNANYKTHNEAGAANDADTDHELQLEPTIDNAIAMDIENVAITVTYIDNDTMGD